MLEIPPGTVRGLCCSVLGLLLLAGPGCGEGDPVRRYQAPKLATGAGTDRPHGMNPSGSLGTPAATGPQRTLAAVVPHAGRGWFFKVTGGPEAVEAHRDRFERLVASLRFKEGTPRWDVPEGWREQPESGMRAATFVLEADAPLELTVIPLPLPAGDPAEYVLSNVNRWRDQLGLPPLSREELPNQSRTIQLADGVATLVDLVGPGSDEPAVAAPPADSAGGARPPAEGASRETGQPAPP